VNRPHALATSIPVVLVEDIRVLRDGLTEILRAQGLKVVAALRGADDALRRILQLRPRLLLLDSSSGQQSAPQLIEAVRQASPDVRAVVMDVDPASSDVIGLARAGAAGFIVKDATIDEFIATVRQVASGLCVVPPRVAAVLLAHIAMAEPRARTGDSHALTVREWQVTRLISVGCSNKEVASRLNITVSTVKSHVHSIFQKLGFDTRLQLVSFAHSDPEHVDVPPARMVTIA